MKQVSMGLQNVAKVCSLAMATVLLTSSLPVLTSSGQAEGLLEEIRSEGKLVVGTEAAFPPFEYVEDGEIVGYGKDILDLIVEDLSVELEQLDLPWQGILPGILAGQFDLVATSVSITPERVQKYAFTIPIGEGTSTAMKRDGDDSIQFVEDLAGKVVGTQLASSGEGAAKAFEEEVLTADGGEGYQQLKLYTSYPEVFLALANGEIDAAISGLPLLAVLTQERPGIYEIVGPIRDTSYMSWVTRPEDTDLRDYINTQLLGIIEDGTLYELQEKWFGFTMEIPTEGYLPEGAL